MKYTSMKMLAALYVHNTNLLAYLGVSIIVPIVHLGLLRSACPPSKSVGWMALTMESELYFFFLSSENFWIAEEMLLYPSSSGSEYLHISL
jgi:hypothetical protein